jgi:hypothetical protein
MRAYIFIIWEEWWGGGGHLMRSIYLNLICINKKCVLFFSLTKLSLHKTKRNSFLQITISNK